VLEGLGLISSAASGVLDDEAFQRRGLRPGLPSLYKTALRRGVKENQPVFIKGEIVWEDGSSYMVTVSNPIASPVKQWSYHHESFQIPGDVVVSRGPRGNTVEGKAYPNNSSVGLLPMVINADARQLIDTLKEYALFTPFTPMLRGTTSDVSKRSPLGLYGGGLSEAVDELIQPRTFGTVPWSKIWGLVPWAAHIDVVAPTKSLVSPSVPTERRIIRIRDRFMIPSRQWLSINDASEGLLYILFLLTISQIEGGPQIFSIDNFDQALNPRLARATMRMFSELVISNDKQVFMTTHNPLVLDGLNIFDTRIKLFTVERGDLGETIIRQIRPTEALAKAEANGYTLSRLWIEGRLGAMPNV
jgi:hypothetical protein